MRSVRAVLNRATQQHLAEEACAIANAGCDGVAALQLLRLNQAWVAAVDAIPAFRAQAEELESVNGFRTLSEFASTVPVLEKVDLASDAVSAETFDFVRRTGGSTGAPTQLASWRSEHAVERTMAALARARHGIELNDRLALVWGHSHLLGDGWRGKLNGLVRRFKDHALGYTRLSAYDTTPEALDKIAERLAATPANYVIGYAHALDGLARRLLQGDNRKVGPFKAVIATAEALPFEDSKDRIEAAFNTPLLLEYGAVETGAIAYARAGRPYETLWSRFLLEAADPQAPISDLLVTALYPRATPLFRYRIGDLVEPSNVNKNGECSLLTFAGLRGRSNQPLVLPSGKSLHSEVVSHVFRANPSIRRYQVAYGGGRVVGRYSADAALDASEIEGLRRVARRIDPEFGDTLELEKVDEPSMTQGLSGKFPIIVSLYEEVTS